MSEGKIPQTVEELEKELGTPSKTEEGFEIKLSTGEVFKGKDWEEVARNMSKGKEDATVAIRDRERQIKDLNDRLASLERAKEPPKDQGKGFDKDRYYELLADDPVAAWQYQAGFAMGIPPEQVAAAMRYAYDTSTVVSGHLANAEFRSKYKDAPVGDEFADMMVERLQERNLGWTAENLGHVYLELVHEGKVKPVKAEPETPNTPEPPPPPPGGNTGEAGGIDVSGMSTAELEKYLRKQGLL